MTILPRIAAAFVICGLLVSVPGEADARRFPSSVKTPKKPAEFKKVKARLKSFKGTGRTAYNNLKGAFRSERRNRQLMQQARNAYNNAQDAYRADRSPQNQQRVEQARQRYESAQAQHNNALSAYRNAKAEVRQLDNIRNTAINNQVRDQGVQPRPVRNGRPNFASGRRVEQVRTGAAVVPNAGALFNGGPMRAYHSELSPQAQALNNNRYQPLGDPQPTNATQNDGSYILPGAPMNFYGRQTYTNNGTFQQGALQQAAPASSQQSKPAW